METMEFLLADAEIRHVLARYPQFADGRDGEAFAGLFTEDGVVRFNGEPIVGRSAIRDWVMAVTAGAPSKHVMVNHLIEVDSSTGARVSLDMVLLAKIDGAWSVQAVGKYTDTLVRTDEGWLFAERIIDLL